MLTTIVSRIYRPEPAAASFFLGAIADELVARGHTVDVLTTRPPRGLVTENSHERIRRWPVLRDRNGYVRGFVQYLSFDLPLLLRILLTRRPAVVLVELPPTTGAVVRIACTLRRIPYVYDASDVWADAIWMATSSGLVASAITTIERFAMRGADRLVAISQGVADRLAILGIDVPVTVTGFGADTDSFSYAEEASERVFIYAGSYSVWHGADVLIDAFADFCVTCPGYRLEFIGNGTERSALEEKARDFGVRESVDFIDPISAGDLASRLSGATASLATLKPGTGYDYAFTSKAYSSLAAGCPVIFAGPGPTGAFIDAANAVVAAGAVAAYDASAIADAMRHFADEPLTPRQRETLAEWTAQEHSMQAVAVRVSGVLEDVAARRDS